MTPEEKYELMMKVLRELDVIRMYGAFVIRYDLELDRTYLYFNEVLMGGIAEKDLRVMAASFGDGDIRVMQEALRMSKARMN